MNFLVCINKLVGRARKLTIFATALCRTGWRNAYKSLSYREFAVFEEIWKLQSHCAQVGCIVDTVIWRVVAKAEGLTVTYAETSLKDLTLRMSPKTILPNSYGIVPFSTAIHRSLKHLDWQTTCTRYDMIRLVTNQVQEQVEYQWARYWTLCLYLEDNKLSSIIN